VAALQPFSVPPPECITERRPVTTEDAAPALIYAGTALPGEVQTNANNAQDPDSNLSSAPLSSALAFNVVGSGGGGARGLDWRCLADGFPTLRRR
jgi:hypothetical protein